MHHTKKGYAVNKLIYFFSYLCLIFHTTQAREVAWSSDQEGFCQVAWKGHDYPAKAMKVPLGSFKAAATLYQGVGSDSVKNPEEEQESCFNNAPNLASASLGFSVTYGDRKKFSGFLW